MKISFVTLLCLGLFVSLTFGSDFRTYLGTPDEMKADFAVTASVKYLLVAAAWIFGTAFNRLKPGARRREEVNNRA